MAQFPGLLLWTDAWIADTVHLSRKERGIYIDLLVLMWRTPGCRVPNDDKWLAKHMLMSLKQVSKELRPIIREFCKCDGNWLFQKRLQIEFVRAFKRSHKQSGRAKSRWEREKGLSRGNAARAMHLSQERKIESYLGRATSVDNSEPDEPPQEVADKKTSKVSEELMRQIQAKRAAEE